MCNFYTIEFNKYLSSSDEEVNFTMFKMLVNMLDIFILRYNKHIFMTPDINGKTFFSKIKFLDDILAKNPCYEKKSFNYSNIMSDKKLSIKDKLMFWKRNKEVIQQYDYLYIYPHGPLYSNEILPEFKNMIEIVNWKDEHLKNVKEIYALLQVGGFNAEISIKSKELIRIFRKTAEKIELIKEKIEFEEEMFFKESFFKDLKDVLNTHHNTMKLVENLKLNEEDPDVLIKSTKSCIDVLGLLENQLKNITEDIFKKLITENDIEMDFLKEYIKSKDIKNKNNSIV